MYFIIKMINLLNKTDINNLVLNKLTVKKQGLK